MTKNTKIQAENVKRVAKKVFGEAKVSELGLPVSGSEDFSFYTQGIKGEEGQPSIAGLPGAFFFFLTGEKPNQPMIHTNKFDFNDNLIAIASPFWW